MKAYFTNLEQSLTLTDLLIQFTYLAKGEAKTCLLQFIFFVDTWPQMRQQRDLTDLLYTVHA